MSHQTIHLSPVEDANYAPASPTDSYASTEALFIPAPGTPYQTTGSNGTLPLVEDPAPTNSARVLAVDLAIGATQPAIPLSPRAVSTIVEGQTDALCYRPLGPGTSLLRSTGISAARMTRWSWMTPSSGKIGLVLLVYASPDVDGLHESPCDSAPMYVTRSPVSSCPVPCAQYSVPCTL
jgi:hypothetical protein